MSKYTRAFLVLSLLLFVSLSQATRPVPSIPRNTQQEGVEEVDAREVCEGVGEDECLMRRTLAAHTDYIYTRGKNN